MFYNNMSYSSMVSASIPLAENNIMLSWLIAEIWNKVKLLKNFQTECGTKTIRVFYILTIWLKQTLKLAKFIWKEKKMNATTVTKTGAIRLCVKFIQPCFLEVTFIYN